MLTQRIPQTIAERLERLIRLQGTDSGVFVLAVHSFIEGILRERFPLDDTEDDNFYFLIDRFRDYTKSKSGGWFPGLDVLGDICKAHKPTNVVRHHFGNLDVEKARIATQHLRRFCQLASIAPGEMLQKIEAFLDVWKDRKALGEMSAEVKAMRKDLGEKSEESVKLTARLKELEGAQAESEHYRELLKHTERQLSEVSEVAVARNAKIDELRKKVREYTEELRGSRAKEKELEDVRQYLETLRELTLYARTRADYEKTVIRPTPEQKRILEQIKLDSDFLVKGAAGTGKTLVLLKAIEKVKGYGHQGEFGLEGLGGSVALLTYNSTLVKYDRYIASLLSTESGADRISTADSFLRDRVLTAVPGASIDYDIIGALAAKHVLSGFKAADLAMEAETFIWANDPSKAEYVDKVIDRHGMKKPIVRELRARVWAACEAMGAEMNEQSRFSKAWSRIRLLRHAEACSQDAWLPSHDYIFIDEAQDLTAADLKAIRACARRCVVLAGDADQSIYQPGFSFKRAGLELGGHSKILRTNFRNTIPVHEYAERYRALVEGKDEDTKPEAFREGPPPELFKGEGKAALLDMLVSRVDVFIRHLEYDPENICILFPYSDDGKAIAERLAGAGYPSVDIRDRSFDFNDSGRIRISTLHSAKGLDFPVVLLFLDRAPFGGDGFGAEETERISRNLIYVAMTRAMDHLNVFVPEAPSAPSLAALGQAWQFGGSA